MLPYTCCDEKDSNRWEDKKMIYCKRLNQYRKPGERWGKEHKDCKETDHIGMWKEMIIEAEHNGY